MLSIVSKGDLSKDDALTFIKSHVLVKCYALLIPFTSNKASSLEKRS